MRNPKLSPGAAILIMFSAWALAGCGGTKLLKEPQPIETTQALASESDTRISATLDWVIVRDGPGTWARNADWDEYLVRVENLRDEPVQIIDITVVDSLGMRIDSRKNRRQLVKGTKQTQRRYKNDGITVEAGLSGTTMVGAAAGVAAGSSGLGAAAIYGSGATAGAAAAVVVLTPVVAVGGIARGINNSKVDAEIRSRQTPLPVELASHEQLSLNVFFPLAPSPRQIEITYVDSLGEGVLLVNTADVLDGLHLTRSGE